ncbi:ABC transporter B family member 12 (ABC transporter ABCB.12) (AtABCB12) (Multidrug resistance protein 16) (P-glycoprotein 12) [Durusdinium trenchii]|uniref:ABC transporter B family member 12 (ABC transporter ABCB.12) (AtABCB12) (Multidrug resistance protein 16) (P-glycoprotein 12) n=1 Tax=Durusdinium trenchii TaxID=1381693 RepID=A0ABP0HA42_9DINO
MRGGSREESVRRWIYGAVVVGSLLKIIVRWLTAVLIRHCFDFLLENNAEEVAVDEAVFVPNSAFWEAVFLTHLSFWQVVGITMGGVVVSALSQSIQLSLAETFANERVRALRRRIIRQGLRRSFETSKISFMLQEAETVRLHEAGAYWDRKDDLVMLVFATTLGLVFTPLLAGITLGALAVLLLVPMVLNKMVLSESDHFLQALWVKVHRLATDICRTVDVVAVSVMEDVELAKLAKLESEALPVERFRRKATLAMRAVDFCLFYGIHPMLVIVVYLTIQSSSLAEGMDQLFAVVLFLLIVDGANSALGHLKATDQEFSRYAVSLKGLEEFLGNERDDNDTTITKSPATAEPTGQMEGDIVAKDLQITFPPQNPIVYPLEVRFRFQEATALTGDSGSGKSSLLRAVAGLVVPSRGSIHFGPTILLPSTLQTARKRLAWVSQDSLLFARSLRENVWYGNDESDPEMLSKVRFALEQVGLLEWVDSLENGVEHTLDLNESQVSGGQAQRLQIARLLCKDPAVVLLDEPLSALDGHNRSTIITFLKPWLVGRTTIWITHNDEVTRKVCDNHIHLDQPVTATMCVRWLTGTLVKKCFDKATERGDGSVAISTSAFWDAVLEQLSFRQVAAVALSVGVFSAACRSIQIALQEAWADKRARNLRRLLVKSSLEQGVLGKASKAASSSFVRSFEAVTYFERKLIAVSTAMTFVFQPMLAAIAFAVLVMLLTVPNLLSYCVLADSNACLKRLLGKVHHLVSDIVRTGDVIAVAGMDDAELAKLDTLEDKALPLVAFRTRSTIALRLFDLTCFYALLPGLVSIVFFSLDDLSVTDAMNQVFAILLFLPVLDACNIAFQHLTATQQEAVRYLNALEHLGELDKRTGKSSLLKAIAGLVQPSQGTIHFGQVRLEPSTLRGIRKTMAMVCQDSLLFARSLCENVWYGNDEGDSQMRNKVRFALEQVGLLEWVDSFEDGLEHTLDLNESQVSGGQAQRLQIARLLCKDPAVVLLDEPLSALDGRNRGLILSHLKEFLAGRTTVWITHNDGVVREFCNSHIHLDQPVAINPGEGSLKLRSAAPANPGSSPSVAPAGTTAGSAAPRQSLPRGSGPADRAFRGEGRQRLEAETPAGCELTEEWSAGRPAIAARGVAADGATARKGQGHEMGCSGEVAQERVITAALVVRAVTTLALRWLTAVLVRKCFEKALELFATEIPGDAFEPSTAFWSVVFMESLDFWSVFGIAVALAATAALCRALQFTLQDSWANARARRFRKAIVSLSLQESVVKQDDVAVSGTAALLQEVDRVRGFEASLYFERVVSAMSVVSCSIFAFAFHVRLAAIAMSTLVILLVVPKLLSNRILAANDMALTDLVRQVHHLASDIVRTADVVAVSCMAKFELGKLDTLEGQAVPIEAQRSRRIFSMRLVDQTFFFLLHPFLPAVVFLWLDSEASFEDAIEQVFALLLMILVIDGANTGFSTLKASEQEAQRYSDSLRHVKEWIGQGALRSQNDTDSKDNNQGGSNNDTDGDVVAKDLEITFNVDAPIVYPAEVRFHFQETTALTGDSGSGKSSLLKALAGLVAPTRGSIHFGAKLLRPSSLESVRSRLGWVSQDSLLFARSFCENVWYGNDENDPHMKSKVRLALDQVGLLQWVDSFEDGIDHVLKFNESEVSGGQAQRLQIARLLCKDPAVVLLDEPLSALDGRNRGVIMSHMKDFLKGRTSVWITHNTEVVTQICTHHVHLAQPDPGVKTATSLRVTSTSSSSSTEDTSGPEDAVVVVA